MNQYIIKVPSRKAAFFEELCKQLSLECKPYENGNLGSANKPTEADGLKKALDAIEDQRKKL